MQTDDVGLGDGLVLAPELALGLGEDVPVGFVPLVGSVSRFCTDWAVKVTFWFPPKKTPISGVRRRKWPVTRTVTVFPIPVSQVTGLQLTVTSVGATDTPPLDSSFTRQ